MGLIAQHNCILAIPALSIVVSEKNIFSCFSYYKPIPDPRGMIGRIYKGYYYPLLYTKYKSPGLCGFREEDFYGFPVGINKHHIWKISIFLLLRWSLLVQINKI